MKNKTVHKGFTLMEILVSVGVLAIIATLLTQVLFTTVHVNKKAEILSTVKQEGNFALDVISRMIRSAKVISVPCALGDDTADSADITNPDSNVTTFECHEGRIASESATGSIVYLTGGNLSLSPSGTDDCINQTLRFTCPPADGSIQKQVTVTFTLGQVGESGSVYESGSAAFSSTVSMRN